MDVLLLERDVEAQVEVQPFTPTAASGRDLAALLDRLAQGLGEIGPASA
jgi:hypothetical protein